MAAPKICDLLREHDASAGPFVAFEYFPPRTDAGVANLRERFARMAHLGPLYADMTWGAGGTTSDLTLELCTAMQRDHGLVANMHVTCTNMDEGKVHAALVAAKEAGIRNIVALRGDAPVGQTTWVAVEGGFNCALDLVRHIRASFGDHFCVSVSGYPEGHPMVIKPVPAGHDLSASELLRVVQTETGPAVCLDADYESELAYLKQKVDAGADLILTQMFFDAAVFAHFVAGCRRVGILCPIIPGLMLIQNYGGFVRMTGFCKSRVPAELKARVEAIKDDEAALKAFGVDFGVEMSRALMALGAPGLHYYTLNTENVVVAILEELGLGNTLTTPALATNK